MGFGALAWSPPWGRAPAWICPAGRRSSAWGWRGSALWWSAGRPRLWGPASSPTCRSRQGFCQARLVTQLECFLFFLAQSDARTIICHKQSFQRLKKSFESSSKNKLVIECFLGHLQPQIVVFVDEDYIQRFPPEIGEEGCSVHHNWLKYGFG